MIDPQFITKTVEYGRQAREKVVNELSTLTREQLNWKPSPSRWSVGKCLEHLFISDGHYFDDLREIVQGTYRMNWIQRYNPQSGFWGYSLKKQLQETVKRKHVAPKKFTPSSSDKPADFVQAYLRNLDTFLDPISKSDNVDLDKTVITSPSVSMITYSLRDAYQFLIQHEHRHINQAIRVKHTDGFPVQSAVG